MFSVMESTSNHLSLEELTGLHSWEGSWVIWGVTEELEESGRWDGEPGVRVMVPHFSFLLISDWLHSADRLCPDGIGSGGDTYQLLGFITSYSATPVERESSIRSIYISVPGWILIGSPWMLHLPLYQPLCPA